ncbi:hypothetical protein [Gordonia sihwensis]|uniref:hypothetical protein n=1 Tax=Gordonia sihwensis TaxID=173559 RepID=UPI0005EFE1C8|nr:hypothetical protein [Gordonia sihwensis]KJR10262.1 hypothetical protein UG54_01395 [Gordonia sihwensis]
MKTSDNPYQQAEQLHKDATGQPTLSSGEVAGIRAVVDLARPAPDVCVNGVALNPSASCGEHCHGWCLLDDAETCAEGCAKNSAVRPEPTDPKNRTEQTIDEGDTIFRAAWLAADSRGETGGRVKAGIRALYDAGWRPTPGTTGGGDR